MNSVRFLSVILGVAAFAPLHAADPWPLPLFTSDPKAVLEAAGHRAASSDTGIVLLDFQSTMRFQPGGRIDCTQRVVYLIVNETGVSRLPRLSQTWQPWRTAKPTIRARVIGRDGNPHLLDPATITEAGVATQVTEVYSDLKILNAPLPAIAPGAVVEAEIESDDREAVNPGGKLEVLALPGDVPIQFFKLTLELPAGAPLHWEPHGMPKLDRSESTTAEIRRVELTATDLPPFKPLALAPPSDAGSAGVVISDVADWREVANWYSGVIERQIGVPQPAIDANTDAAPHMDEIETILADIQKQVRYTGLELGYAAFEPRAPSETLTRGYGDCKDKATLLVSRLRKAGIASTLALLTPYPSPDVIPGVPGMEAFIHAIVYVPGKHPLWIDPTAEFAPARRLPLADQGRLALIVDPQTKDLVRTPDSKPSDNQSVDDFTLTLSEDGRSKLELVHEEQGGTEDFARASALAASQAPESRREAMITSLQKIVTGKVKNVDWGSPKNLGKPVRVVVQADDVPNTGASGQSVYAVIAGSAAQAQLAALFGAYRSEKDSPEAKIRKDDYWLPAAFLTTEKHRVVPPPGFRLKQLPKVGDLAIGPLNVIRKVSLQPDGSVLFEYRCESPHSYTPEEAAKIWAAAEKTPMDSFRLEFMAEGALLMSDGKWKEGVAKLRNDAEADSATVPAILRYSAGLLEAGFRDDAIAVCRKAIELDPKSAEAYARLGFLYRHDRIGRLDGFGRDQADSEKAIRKAMELDPENKQYVADLATLLEWKDNMERFADMTASEESIKLLQGISKELPDLQLTEQLPTELYYARRFADMQAFYSRPEGARTRGDLRVAGVAAAEDSAAAIREAERLFPGEAQRRPVLSGAGQHLLNIGEYSKAADLLHEASGGTTLQSDLDLLRKSRHGSAIKFSSNGPVAALQRYILSLFGQASGFVYSDLLVPDWNFVTFHDQQSTFLGLTIPLHQVAGVQLKVHPFAEIVASATEFLPEGSDAIGYRIRFADPTKNGARKTLAWVVKRGDNYRILSLGAGQSPVGGEALAQAQKGDLAAAKRWLNWEREEITAPSSADPLAAEPFLKLWPPRPGVPEKDQVLAAAASLVARGHYYRQGIDVLLAIRAGSRDRSFQGDLDFALADGLSIHTEYAEAAPIWRRVHQQYPDSEVAFTALGLALVRSGHPDEAQALAASVKADDDLFAPAQRTRARAFQLLHKYPEAVQAYRLACKSSKAGASDWNNEAWLTLFAPGELKPDLDGANTANRLTQGRNTNEIHTLGSVQAETGQLKEARQALVRYLAVNSSLPVSDAAQYLNGRIAEGIGLSRTAEQVYSAIAQDNIDSGDTPYDLAQIRLQVMHRAK